MLHNCDRNRVLFLIVEWHKEEWLNLFRGLKQKSPTSSVRDLNFEGNYLLFASLRLLTIVLMINVTTNIAAIVPNEIGVGIW